MKEDSLSRFGSFFFVVQIKGSKRTSHSQEATLNMSMKAALEKFKSSFHELDWVYMNNRENGELICDVGVTIHPHNSKEPLVGLWRLDCLEASYGAAGFLSGQLHTLNTLSMFGGLQATSPASRRNLSHILFRISYNLAYEAIRQQDNSRDMLKEKEVYNRTPTFQYEMNWVRTVYNTKATGQSYGVRDEFRIGGAALDILMDCIDESVGDILTL